jgi:haloalkane dehalogenase
MVREEWSNITLGEVLEKFADGLRCFQPATGLRSGPDVAHSAGLPKLIIRTLTSTEMDAYRRPFIDAKSRWPTLVWPRELPIAGEPADVVKIVEDYGQWILQSPLPKLFFNAEPGSLLIGRARQFCHSLPNQQEVTVRGIHFIQEDSPDEIGSVLARFVAQTRPGARIGGA